MNNTYLGIFSLTFPQVCHATCTPQALSLLSIPQAAADCAHNVRPQQSQLHHNPVDGNTATTAHTASEGPVRRSTRASTVSRDPVNARFIVGSLEEAFQLAIGTRREEERSAAAMAETSRSSAAAVAATASAGAAAGALASGSSGSGLKCPACSCHSLAAGGECRQVGKLGVKC